MILTEEFLITHEACQEGITFAHSENLLGKNYGDVVKDCIKKEQKDFAGWLLDQKNTEAYVRWNGKEITMGESYQVFNPWTGTHTVCPDLESAKALITEISNSVLESHKVTACKELKNENGDAVWVPVEFPYAVSITVNTPQV
jgi:hypothetical protein